MTFRPLFFLPRAARRWAYDQAMSERLLDTPFGCLFWSADHWGVEFWYRGDTVVWMWPWTRHGKAPFVSLGFSGNGDFGEARYWTLKALDADWDAYFAACADLGKRATEQTDQYVREYVMGVAAEDLKVGQSVTIDSDQHVRAVT